MHRPRRMLGPMLKPPKLTMRHNSTLSYKHKPKLKQTPKLRPNFKDKPKSKKPKTVLNKLNLSTRK